MTELDDQTVAADPEDERKKLKKAEKARRAWMTFAGRIVAQIVGRSTSDPVGIQPSFTDAQLASGWRAAAAHLFFSVPTF